MDDYKEKYEELVKKVNSFYDWIDWHTEFGEPEDRCLFASISERMREDGLDNC